MRKKASKGRFLFTEEWYDGGVNHVSAYGERSQKEIDDICEQMGKYSPYDFVDSVVCDTEEEYKSYLQTRIDKGAEVKYYNQN